jgi:glucosamine-6-phosphate deaminase
MKILKFNTYEEMSAAAADIFAKQINIKKDSVLGLATGSTPIGMYQRLIEMNKSGIIDFSKIKSVNLDEYYPISPSNHQSYRYFMNTNLFDHININKDNTYVPDGSAEDPDAECVRYEEVVHSLGGIDIQILGIGQNGHIGFNEPEEELYLATHKTSLTESTLEANARFFSEDETMPNSALTMGMGTIFSAKKIILLVSGKSKREVFKQLLTDRISTSCPATLLKLHPNVTVLCDSEAYGE